MKASRIVLTRRTKARPKIVLVTRSNHPYYCVTCRRVVPAKKKVGWCFQEWRPHEICVHCRTPVGRGMREYILALEEKAATQQAVLRLRDRMESGVFDDDVLEED